MAEASRASWSFRPFRLPAVGFQSERAGERGHRVFDIDDGIAGADGFTGQVDQHQPGLLAIGKPYMHEVALRTDRGTGLDAKRRGALLAVPLADIIAGILVGQADLALDGV